jgi:hypothetical protein
LLIRQAARHVSQFYDQHLAPSGLHITQFSILAKLKAGGPLTINNLAELMVMDRTTLGRNILPLEAMPELRDGRLEAVLTSAGVDDILQAILSRRSMVTNGDGSPPASLEFGLASGKLRLAASWKRSFGSCGREARGVSPFFGNWNTIFSATTATGV